MRTETKTIKIYNFDELSEEIKQKLIEKEIEYQHELYCEDFLESDMEYKANELLKKYFKNNNATLKKVYYALSYCQGDGAMFEFDLYYYNKHVSIKHYGYYNKALMYQNENNLKNYILVSYNTIVAEINGSEFIVYGYYSQTTARHINIFLNWFGLKGMSKKEMEQNANKWLKVVENVI